jgi:hypothetical protein
VDLGLRLEQTKREGEVYEEVSLSSAFLDAGLKIEFVKQLSLLVGAKYCRAKGNEFIEQRNRYNTIENFVPTEFDFKERAVAGGLSYDFGKGTHLTLQYQKFSMTHPTQLGIDYAIPQVNVLFNLDF